MPSTEEDPVPVPKNTPHFHRILIGLNLSPNQFQITQNIQYIRTLNNPDYQNNHRLQLEDIPELENEDEDWEEGQFVDADLIEHHNTTTESD